jgi:putative oxidoreductase
MKGISPCQAAKPTAGGALGALFTASGGRLTGEFIMKKIVAWFNHPPTNAPAATVALRLMAGSVFFWEGLLKFVYVNQGVGRFTKLGMPVPEMTAAFVAWVEIVGGLWLLTGFLTRYAAFTFIIEMLVAMASTKIGVFLGNSPLPAPPSPPFDGFWAVLHEIRSEYAQLLTAVFLFIAGSGPWSADAFLAGKKLGEYSGRHREQRDAAIEEPVGMAVDSDDTWSDKAWESHLRSLGNN